MADDPADKSSGQIPTNLRLLLVLDAVAEAGVPVSPATVGETLGLPKPTIHRLFQTAEAEGYLQRDIDGRSYGPGPKLRRLSVSVLTSQRIRAARLAVLTAVAEEVGETCNIAIPDREGMVYLDRVETKWPLRIQLPVGTEVPFHCTASGKMYLSSLRPDYVERLLAVRPLEARTARTITDPAKLKHELAETRKRGHAEDDEEFMEGMAAIAVPLLDHHGRVLSTLSIHAPVQRHNLTSLRQNLTRLQSAARQLAEITLS